MKYDILVVEDNSSLRRMLQDTLESEGLTVATAENGETAVERLGQDEFRVVITDLKLPGKLDGMDVLYASKTADPSPDIFIMTAFGTIEAAVTAMKQGALDFLTKPFDSALLVLLVKRALDQHRLRTENYLLREAFSERLGAPQMVGESPAFAKVLKETQKVGVSNATVLLLGESGTGKELLARAIHHISPRRNYPFVAINCAAIPETLLETELFGHERGAFTGADRKKFGKFELADKGTIFLDEIGDMSLNLQAKLLRVLQEREFERIGGTKTISVDVRVIAASNQNLARRVRDNLFRSDLFYRLSVFPLLIPPLRDRKEDIISLADHFIKKFCTEMKKPILELSAKSTSKLLAYHWPGNVRELQNSIERAVILANSTLIQPEDLGLMGIDETRDIDLSGIPLEGSLQEATQLAKEAVERVMINRALLNTGGNKLRAAKELQVNYKTLLSKIRDYQLAGISDLDFSVIEPIED